MVEIREVKNRREIKRFIEFPLNLYKGNPYFAPPLYSDEKSSLNVIMFIRNSATQFITMHTKAVKFKEEYRGFCRKRVTRSGSKAGSDLHDSIAWMI